jgi:hypothetical protein
LEKALQVGMSITMKEESWSKKFMDKPNSPEKGSETLILKK